MMENPFIQAPPASLRKQFQGVRLVTREEAALHMDHYNQWAARWNELNDKRSGPLPSHDSIHGLKLCDPSRRTMFEWFPYIGPTQIVVYHEVNNQREWPLTFRAKLSNFDTCATNPRPFVKPEQIRWAAWVNFWCDFRPGK